jgi:hypothetical protein
MTCEQCLHWRRDGCLHWMPLWPFGSPESCDLFLYEPGTWLEE